MDEYTYPDKQDNLVANWILEAEPFPGYWKISEAYIIDQILPYLQKLPVNQPLSFLDAGAGEGRMIPLFEQYFNQITALEPDTNRLLRARQNIEELGLSSKVDFIAGKIETLDVRQKYDFILCSHIIQHVSLTDVPLILSKLNELLKPGAILAILTCHSQEKGDKYSVTQKIEGKVVEKLISEDDFSRLFNSSEVGLPAHFFGMKSLKQKLETLGLSVMETRSFHILNNFPGLDRLILRDKWINFFPVMKTRFGRDMLVIAKKAAKKNT